MWANSQVSYRHTILNVDYYLKVFLRVLMNILKIICIFQTIIRHLNHWAVNLTIRR